MKQLLNLYLVYIDFINKFYFICCISGKKYPCCACFRLTRFWLLV